MCLALALLPAACGSSDPATTGTSSSSPSTSSPSSTTTETVTTTTGTTAEPAPLPVEGTGVHGRVRAGPTCPVERPDQPCPPNPVAGRVDAINAAGRTAGVATTDAVGRYAIALAPGDYTLRVLTEGMFPTCPDTAVLVALGPPLTVDIGCDTGIR